MKVIKVNRKGSKGFIVVGEERGVLAVEVPSPSRMGSAIKENFQELKTCISALVMGIFGIPYYLLLTVLSFLPLQIGFTKNVSREEVEKSLKIIRKNA